MAISYALVSRDPTSNKTVTDITLDGSYSAGGYAVTAAGLGVVQLPANMDLTYIHATATNDFVPVWDPTNSKIKIFCSGTASATLNECTSGQITSSHKIRVTSHAPIVL